MERVREGGVYVSVGRMFPPEAVSIPADVSQ